MPERSTRRKTTDPVEPRRSTEVDTPIGVLRLVTRAETLCALEFTDTPTRPRSAKRRQRLPAGGIMKSLEQRLQAYFAGDLSALEGIPVDPEGTRFERRVWRALLRIPAGKTLTYGEIARKLGVPNAARAVGGACGRNPIVLVIPCHRVIGANGSLTGFGGGIELKRWLLRHEGAQLQMFRAEG